MEREERGLGLLFASLQQIQLAVPIKVSPSKTSLPLIERFGFLTTQLKLSSSTSLLSGEGFVHILFECMEVKRDEAAWREKSEAVGKSPSFFYAPQQKRSVFISYDVGCDVRRTAKLK